MNCRLLLVDDHALIRAGVRALLQDRADYSIVGEAKDGQEAIELALTLGPDIILMDISMHPLSGLQALPLLAQSVPQCKVLMLSMHDESEIVLQALHLGARGYLLKDAAVSELYRHSKPCAGASAT